MPLCQYIPVICHVDIRPLSVKSATLRVNHHFNVRVIAVRKINAGVIAANCQRFSGSRRDIPAPSIPLV